MKTRTRKITPRQAATFAALRKKPKRKASRIAAKTNTPATPPVPSFPALTRREAQVMVLIASGLSSQQTAERLYVTKRTVDFHLANSYEKLGVSNRAAAVPMLLQAGVLVLRDNGFHLAETEGRKP